MFRVLFHDYHVLALLAFTVLAAFQASLVALAVFFEAVRFFTVATFEVLVSFYFLAEGVRVAVHKCQYGITPLLTINLEIVAAYTITTFTSLVQSKTIAIKF